jgi:sugar/nucleoside kinase (ribokinase family)
VIIAALKDRDPRLGELITVQTNQSSSYTVVLAPARADRFFLHSTGTNSAFSAANVDFGLLRQARLFHLGYPPVLPRLIADDGVGLSALYQQAQAAGAVTSLDMTLPDPEGPSGQANWMRILARTLPYVDVFLPSIEEILFMLRRADYDAWGDNVRAHLDSAYLSTLADELLAHGTAVVGFKLGQMGIYLKTAPQSRIARLTRLPLDPAAWGGRTLYTPSFAVEVVNTLGAGDCAYAGFLAALVRGLPPDACIRWACAVGACNCETADATSGVRTWDETQQRMDSGWPAHDVRLSGL